MTREPAIDPRPLLTPDGVAAEFRERFGRGAAGVWSAPGRVNLIGEHTDYNEGLVLPFAIEHRVFVALAPRGDGVAAIASSLDAPGDAPAETVLAELDPDALHGWHAYVLGTVWALGQFAGSLGGGFDLYLDGDVPPQAGLSSSAAVVSAVAKALSEHWGLELGDEALAKAGQLAENRAAGAPTGIMDEFASIAARAGHAVFLDCRGLDAELIPLDLAGEGDADGFSIVLANTHVKHDNADGGYGNRRAACERAAQLLERASLREVTASDLEDAKDRLGDELYRRARHVVTENERVLDTVRVLREAGPGAIGALLSASHDSMRDDFELTVPEIDAAQEAALRAGALGARMTGGGFGGCVIALVAAGGAGAVEDAVTAVFAERGYPTPTFMLVRAADGARREC